MILKSKKTVLLVCGGRSLEHEVSILSAKEIAQSVDLNQFNLKVMYISKDGTNSIIDLEILASLDRQEKELYPTVYASLIRSKEGFILLTDHQKVYEKIDIVFPALLGATGEDGAFQGWLELLNIPYVGCNVGSSFLCFDKEFTKSFLKINGLPVVPSITLNSKDDIPSYEEVCQILQTKDLFIKPCQSGSSIGISYIQGSKKDYLLGIELAFSYSTNILIEKAIQGKEISCAILGNMHPRVSLFGEIVFKHKFYSYEDKYLDPKGKIFIIPSFLKEEEKIKELALKAFRLLKCTGLARIDFFIDRMNIYINEINTFPAFTVNSLYPQLWIKSGLSVQDIVHQLITLGFENYDRKQQLKKVLTLDDFKKGNF